jgi:hypothetical protein
VTWRSGLRGALLAALMVLFTAGAAWAAGDIRTERVQFKRGESTAVVEGTIKGYETVDYVLRANKGQYANISIATKNTANYFNIMAPGQNEVAMFIGSIKGNQYEGILPAGGDYKIRVYLMRSAARRKEVAHYRLEMIVQNVPKDQPKGQAPAGDARVAGTNYRATGKLPCSTAVGQPTGSCLFGVERQGQGAATVTITKPDGRTRAIFFDQGKAVGSDASQADGGEFSVQRNGDLSVVRIGAERYEIPDAVVFGD